MYVWLHFRKKEKRIRCNLYTFQPKTFGSDNMLKV